MMIFMDGFDYLTVANGAQKWTSMAGSLITGVYSRGKALSGAVALSQILTGNLVTGFQAFHLFTGTALPGTNSIICQFVDGTTSQVELRIDNLGRLFFTRNATNIGSVGTVPLNLSQWYWIEAKVKIDPTTGEASVQVNQVAYLTQTGLNTRASANSFFNKLQLSANFSGNQTQAIDSYHFFDTTAGSGNDPSNFYGEHVIDTALGVSDGSNSAWTKSPNTTTHVSKVNEANHDADTTYVFDNVANDIDSYNFAALAPTSGTIGVIAVNSIDRNDDGLTHVMKHYVKSSAAVALGGNVQPSPSYLNHQSLFTLDPNTSAAPTVAARNAMEFGQKFIS